MPPAKSRLSSYVDIHVVQELEEIWRKQQQEQITKQERPISFSEFINQVLKQWLREHHHH